MLIIIIKFICDLFNNFSLKYLYTFIANLIFIKAKMISDQLSPNQNFDQIVIHTPLQQKSFQKITFKDASQNVQKQLQLLLKSSFYKKITVHMGAYSLSNRSYLEDKYKREEEILRLKIQELKDNIRKLSRAQDQNSFDSAMKQHSVNLQLIQERSQQVDYVDYVPFIYFETEKKKPFYGHLMQQFNRKGSGVFNAKFGYRAPFFTLDTIQLKFQTPVANLRRKYFNFDIEWTNHHQKFKHIFIKATNSNQSLYKDIDEKSHSFSFGFDHDQKNIRFQVQNKFRQPNIHSNFVQYCGKNYHLPSFKSAIKLTKVWENSIEFNDINMGKYLQTKGEITIPHISGSQFAKFEVNYRRFYDIYALRKYFDNQRIKNLLYGSSFQTNLSFNWIKMLNQSYVSDMPETMQVRGFDQAKVPNPTTANLKLSGKYNIHNYPWIGQARLTPFIFWQAGFSLLKTQEKKTLLEKIYGMGSTGMGVAYYVSPFIQIQLIYNLLQYQNMKNREISNFQIRIGVFD